MLKGVNLVYCVQDPRVDVCVYFIAPHRLKQIDVEFMKELSLVRLPFLKSYL